MQIDYDVGDCVVCVDAHSAPMLRQGGMYRVSAITLVENCYADAGELGVSVEGVKPLPPYGDFHPRRFRKLPKASDEFTEQMRKLKPHKQKVEARCPISGQPLSVREMFESECG